MLSRCSLLAALCVIAAPLAAAQDQLLDDRELPTTQDFPPAYFERAKTAQQAFDALSADFLAGREVAPADLVMALAMQFDAYRWLGNKPDTQFAVYDRHRLVAKRLATKVRELAAEKKLPKETAFLLTAYQDLANVRLLEKRKGRASMENEADYKEFSRQLVEASRYLAGAAQYAAKSLTWAYRADGHFTLAEVLLALDLNLKADRFGDPHGIGQLTARQHYRDALAELLPKVKAEVDEGKRTAADAQLVELFLSCAKVPAALLPKDPEAKLAKLDDAESAAARAVDTAIAAFVAEDGVPLAYVLVALNLERDTEEARISLGQSPLVDESRHVAKARLLDQKVAELCKAGRRSEGLRSLAKAYRQGAELRFDSLGIRR